MMFALNLLADIIGLFFGLAILFRLFQVNYHNLLVQQVRGLTDIVLSPLRTLLPVVWRLDLAGLAVLLTISAMPLLLVVGFPGPELVGLAAIDAANLLLNLLMYALILLVIMSWVAPASDHPGAEIIVQLTGPMLRPIRRLLGNLLPLDLSPLFALLAIGLCRSLLRDMTVQLSVSLAG